MMGIPNELILPVNADHQSMCRFSEPTNQEYLLIQNAIVEMVSKIDDGESIPAMIEVMLTTYADSAVLSEPGTSSKQATLAWVNPQILPNLGSTLPFSDNRNSVESSERTHGSTHASAPTSFPTPFTTQRPPITSKSSLFELGQESVAKIHRPKNQNGLPEIVFPETVHREHSKQSIVEARIVGSEIRSSESREKTKSPLVSLMIYNLQRINPDDPVCRLKYSRVALSVPREQNLSDLAEIVASKGRRVRTELEYLLTSIRLYNSLLVPAV